MNEIIRDSLRPFCAAIPFATGGGKTTNAEGIMPSRPLFMDELPEPPSELVEAIMGDLANPRPPEAPDAGLPMEERMHRFVRFADDMQTLLRGKGADYTAGKKDEDSLYNFRAIAELLAGTEITPYVVAMIYMLKHLFSLLTFAKTGIQESGEGLRGRHIDLANYSFLLSELVREHEAICQKRRAQKEEAEKIMMSEIV